MALFNNWPWAKYANDLNLSWIIKEITKVIQEQVLLHGEIDDMKEELDNIEDRVNELVQYYITKAIEEGAIEINLVYNPSDESLELVIGG